MVLRNPRHRPRPATRRLRRCVTDPAQTALLTGPGLCHGWAGTTAATWHAARDSGDATLSAAACTLAGPLASSADGDHPYGLIDGYAGAALTLHDLATQAAGTWTRCLLLT
ncbi:MAG: lanthionine synthetase LanC family protein [Streptosporangiaceae bacterium]